MFFQLVRHSQFDGASYKLMSKGDLGVQRGVVRWFLSWHDPRTSSSPVKLKSEKLPKTLSQAPTETSVADKLESLDVDRSNLSVEK
jgi:hypothetical protein